GAASKVQILGDQKTYGLWGLYSTPARSSGLLRSGEPVLTPAGRELVERLYLPALAGNGGRMERQLLALVRRDSTYFIDGQHSELATVLARLLRPRFSQAERSLFDEFLVQGGPAERTGGAQGQLAALLRSLPATEPFGIE